MPVYALSDEPPVGLLRCIGRLHGFEVEVKIKQNTAADIAAEPVTAGHEMMNDREAA
jgi:hypothetical protein